MKEERPLYQALCDADLFERFVARDNDAYTALYHRYGARVYGYIQSLLGGENGAVDDVYQEVFIRLYRERDRVREGAATLVTNVGGWLFRVARNLSLNQIRSQTYLTSIPEGYNEQLITTANEAHANLFGDELDEEELLKAVHEVVRKLPESLREVFILREVNGMSYEETANIVGCSTEAARMRLSRARGAIREALSDFREAHQKQ